MVAPDQRRENVAYEINRPTFARAKSRHCPGICRLCPYSQAAAGVQAEWELCSSLLHKSPCFIIASDSAMLDKLKSQEERIWHICQNIFQGWSRNVLIYQIEGLITESEAGSSAPL